MEIVNHVHYCKIDNENYQLKLDLLILYFAYYTKVKSCKRSSCCKPENVSPTQTILKVNSIYEV